jgi:hypothetical protein
MYISDIDIHPPRWPPVFMLVVSQWCFKVPSEQHAAGSV